MLEITIRITAAIIMGGIIGYEREYMNSPAGFRTHILVAVGSCIISLIQVKMVYDTLALINGNEVYANAFKIDIGRMGAQVISGIGFLGAGTILHTKGAIKGLTTAASIWVVGCLGLSIGLGYYQISFIGTVSSVVVLTIFKYIEKKVKWKNNIHKIYIEYINTENVIENIEKFFLSKDVKILNSECYISDEELRKKMKSCLLTIRKTKAIELSELILKCSINNDIVKIYEVKES